MSLAETGLPMVCGLSLTSKRKLTMRKRMICLNDVVTSTESQDSYPVKGLLVPWGWVSIILATLTAASVGTLVTVVAITDADTLSTVALALAVLAFAAQLIITLVDGHQSSQVNAETRSILAEMKATTAAVLTNQNDQFNVVLKALVRVVPKAVQDLQDSTPESQDDVAASPEGSKELIKAITEGLAYELKANVPTPGVAAPVPGGVERAQQRKQIAKRLSKTPDRKVGEPIVELLNEMPPKELARLYRFARDVVAQGRPHARIRYRRAPGVGPNPLVRALVEKGLVRTVAEPDLQTGGPVIYELTSSGWVAATLLRMPSESLPDWAASLA